MTNEPKTHVSQRAREADIVIGDFIARYDEAAGGVIMDADTAELLAREFKRMRADLRQSTPAVVDALHLPWRADPDDRPGYEWNWHVYDAKGDRVCFMANGPDSEAKVKHLVDAANAALSAHQPQTDPQGEAGPVAWLYEKNGKQSLQFDRQEWLTRSAREWAETPLYAAPQTDPQAEGVREAMDYGWIIYGPDGEWHWSPQRDEHESVTDQRPATAIEAALASRERERITQLEQVAREQEALLRETRNLLADEDFDDVAGNLMDRIDALLEPKT